MRLRRVTGIREYDARMNMSVAPICGALIGEKSSPTSPSVAIDMQKQASGTLLNLPCVGAMTLGVTCALTHV
jgi:hypothetical protein